MNSTVLFLYFLLFMTTLVSAIVFMWKSMTETFKELGKPTISNVHPEMRDVQSGTEPVSYTHLTLPTNREV